MKTIALERRIRRGRPGYRSAGTAMIVRTAPTMVSPVGMPNASAVEQAHDIIRTDDRPRQRDYQHAGDEIAAGRRAGLLHSACRRVTLVQSECAIDCADPGAMFVMCSIGFGRTEPTHESQRDGSFAWSQRAAPLIRV